MRGVLVGVAAARSRRRSFSLPAVVLLAACGGGSSATAIPPVERAFGGGESPTELRAQLLEVEELTSECMKGLGWDYVPVDLADRPTGDGVLLDYTDPDFGESYGLSLIHI